MERKVCVLFVILVRLSSLRDESYAIILCNTRVMIKISHPIVHLLLLLPSYPITNYLPIHSCVILTDEQDDDDEEMEWVEEEFELLTERDFYNTEWKIGTLMDGAPRSPTSIDTTWVRLMTTEDGTNKAVWGDGSKGKWTIDVPSQFFSISKETFGGWLGKRIWAGTIEDFYYLEGTVRGWSPISPASVDGQWQAIRLGSMDGGDRVTAEERGLAPWFMEEEEDQKEEEGDDDANDEV